MSDQDSNNTSNETKATSEKGYYSMLEAVENLVAKEGKNLKEAVLIAEEKLSEWGELGREEVDTISAEVKRDLGSLGETIEEAKLSFREKWQLESKYLSDSTWNILSSVADKTTVALAEFSDDLQQRVKEAQKDLHEREHKDHRQWHSDHEMWLDEVESWQKEYRQADQVLQTAREIIQARVERLAEHAKTIHTHDYIDKAHEKDIAHSEQDPDNPVIEEISGNNKESYEEMIQKHKEEADFHLKFKQEYRSVMAAMAKLKRLVD